MTRQVFFALCLVFIFPFCSFSQNPKEGLKALNWMIGKWSIATEEQDSDGSFFKESGFKECTYVSKGRMIRCEMGMVIEETGGRYVGKWKSREFIIYFSYDQENDQFIQRLIFPNRIITHDFKAKSASLYEGHWVNKGQEIGGDMDMVFQIKVIDQDNYQRIEHLESRNSDFVEHYVETSRRIY